MPRFGNSSFIKSEIGINSGSQFTHTSLAHDCAYSFAGHTGKTVLSLVAAKAHPSQYSPHISWVSATTLIKCLYLSGPGKASTDDFCFSEITLKTTHLSKYFKDFSLYSFGQSCHTCVVTYVNLDLVSLNNHNRNPSQLLCPFREQGLSQEDCESNSFAPFLLS